MFHFPLLYKYAVGVILAIQSFEESCRFPTVQTYFDLILRMEISIICMLIVLLSFSSAFSELCDITTDADMKWRRHPDDCSSAFMCLLGQVVSYSCPDGFVIGAYEISCIPSGSPTDDCKFWFILQLFSVPSFSYIHGSHLVDLDYYVFQYLFLYYIHSHLVDLD